MKFSKKASKAVAAALKQSKDTKHEAGSLDFDEVYLRRMGRHVLLSPEDERQLLIKACVEKDPKAVEDLVVKNMRFVYSCAGRYSENGSTLYLDLVSAGIVGMYDAIHRFDVNRVNENGAPLRFSTYAGWWILASIRAELEKQSPKVPSKYRRILNQFKTASTYLKSINEFPPTDDEVFVMLGWEQEEIETYYLAKDRTQISIEALEESSQETGEMHSALLVDEEERIDNELSRPELKHKLMESISKLSAQERLIIKRHFGIGYSSEGTYDELAAELGCTRETVRRIENSALKTLWALLYPIKNDIELG